MKTVLFLLFYSITVIPTIAQPAISIIGRADSLFAHRCDRFDAARLLADSTAVFEALHLYRSAIETADNNDEKQEALWKYLQAAYFKSQFIDRKPSLRKVTLAKAIETGETHLAEFPDSVELHNWLGILWSRWSEVYGIIAAARKGVANKVRFYAERSVELDPHYLDGGGWRLLGMVNFKVPHIHLLLTWPSKKKAYEYLSKAYNTAPNNLYNQLYYAEIIADAGDRDRAIAMLSQIVALDSVRHDPAIDAFAKRNAAALLTKLSQ
ncbi:MAG: hypothetical protein EHM72_18290 [Calditrichaeota bacterium]|nr:MAG: hypothetical protein EHM72_18290 [Calditrichota bacterium]